MTKQIIITFNSEAFGTKTIMPKALAQLFELRRWCRENIKGKWYSYQVGNNTECNSPIKHFYVFEFVSDKDAMLFSLYTGT